MKEVFLGTKKPFVFEGQDSPVGLYKNNDGRMHLKFCLDEANEDPSDITKKNLARVGFRVFGNKCMFLGMYVPFKYRGIGLSKEMFRYFTNDTRLSGLEFMGTGIIHKPVLALLLKREGLVPEDVSCRVEILPKSSLAQEGIPEVQILSYPDDRSVMVSGSESGSFYRVIDPDVVTLRYPIGDPSHIVALHTRYKVPDNFSI